ncbi:MAG: sulfotransferase [Myxococcota bacterium]
MRPPLYIVGPPRSATTALAELLALHPDIELWTHEAHRFHHDLARFDHRTRADDHFWLTAADVTEPLRREYRDAIAGFGGVQPLIKVSTASIQIDFVRAIFPEARFIQILREPLDVIASMEDLRQTLEADQEHARLLGPAPDPFGLSIAETFEHVHLRAAAAWFFHAVRSELDLRFAGSNTFHRVRYRDLLVTPDEAIENLLAFAGLSWDDALNPGIQALSTAPAGPGSLGYSTTETSSASRVDRYARSLTPDLVHAIAPLLEVPARLWGFDYGKLPDDDGWASACLHEHIAAEPWMRAVRDAVAQAESELNAFDPVTFLRQPDHLEPDTRMRLLSGTSIDTQRVAGDPAHTTTVRKQNRSTRFSDPDGAIAALLCVLDGELEWSSLEFDLPDAMRAREIIERLHGLGVVAFGL